MLYIMKKLFFAAIAIAALASCNKDQVINFDKFPINFGEAFVDNSVRATDNTYGVKALTAFKVYGTVTGTAGTVNIFNGDAVTGTVGQNVWSCDNQQYWIPGADYNFAAVVDANAVGQDTYKMPTTITYQTEGQKDLLYATATVDNATATQELVNFTFSHLLSKAQFTVTSNTAGGYYHSVTGIKVSNFETGTYTIAGGTWAGTTPKDIEFGSVEEVTAESGEKTNLTQVLLIPNTATFNVSFTVELYKDGVKLGTETITKAVETNLVAGHAYNFTIACSVGNPIQFKVENDPTWADEPDITVQ